ncbi:hypothetical protein AB5I83_02495 [Mesobacillus sp. LC4]
MKLALKSRIKDLKFNISCLIRPVPGNELGSTYYKYVSKKKRFPLFLEIILIRGKHYDNLLTELALLLKNPYITGV